MTRDSKERNEGRVAGFRVSRDGEVGDGDIGNVAGAVEEGRPAVRRGYKLASRE